APCAPRPTRQAANQVGAAYEVSYAGPAKSGSCRKGTVMATGTFTTNGTGGSVSYAWIRTDNRGSVTIAEPPIIVAPGDTSSHSVTGDSWNPNSGGSEQLVFLSTGAPLVAAQTFVCR